MFLLLAVAQTWPMAAAPSHWARTDPGDGAFNIWVLSWVAHTLPHPSRLFDANIFYPEHLTLAYSEAMIVQGVLAMPVIAAGGSPVLAYNITLILGMTLTGWAFCLLVRRWTGSWSAGYVSGSLAAFNAFSLVRITHLQFQHVEFVALAMYALDRLLVDGRVRHAITLGVAFALQALASIYTMTFTTWLLLFGGVSRLAEVLRPDPKKRMVRLAVAAAVAGVILFPYLAEYWQLHERMHFVRGADEEQAASWVNYLSTASRVHYNTWSKPFTMEATATNFPGVIAIILVVFALTRRDVRSDPRARMCAAAALGCAAVSFAPLLPFYPRLHAAIPLFQMVRVLPYIAQMVLLMIAVLAGFGVASLQQRWRHARSWPLAAALAVLAVNVEAARAPMGYVWFDGVPAVYDVLTKEPTAAVVELPFPMPQQWFLNTPYMVNSTRYWRPLLNGYSGFRPPSYSAHYDLMRRFPSDDALIELLKQGVTHVVVHQRAMNQGAPDGRYNPFESVPSLQLIARDEDVLIYRLRGR